MATVIELRKLASMRRIKGRSKMNKEQLLAALGSQKSSRAKKSKPTFMVYTKVGCPYCKDAKALLKKKGFEFSTKTITNSNRDSVYASIDSKTKGYRYFPVIMRNGRFLGGYTELLEKYG